VVQPAPPADVVRLEVDARLELDVVPWRALLEPVLRLADAVVLRLACDEDV